LVDWVPPKFFSLFFSCHSRESGNPFFFFFSLSFPRKRESILFVFLFSCHSRESGNPGALGAMAALFAAM